MTNWNERYVANDTPWDKGMATPVLAEIRQRHPELFSGAVVSPGCGAGYDARWLADAGCRATGLDIAPLAIEKAKALDPEGKASFEIADILNPPAAYHGAFDWLWEHTCFCALDPSLREAYVKAASVFVKPGGRVIGVFFPQPEMDEGETGPPFGIDALALQSLWEDAVFTLVFSWVPVTGFNGRIGRELVMIFDAM